MQLKITTIRTDGGTQPRATYHYGIADAYAEDMEAGVNFPPVIVFYDGADYWLADGFHRVLAATKIGREAIDADVRQGALQDAQWYSYSVNQAHGLRRSNEDKRRAAEAALRHPKAAEMSDHQIADHCGVSGMFVGNIRREMAATLNGLKSNARKGRDGRTINTSNIGKKSKGKQPSAPKQSSNGTVAVPDPDDDEPLTPYEEQLAAQLRITEPARADPKVLTQEVDRLIQQYCYDDLRLIIEQLTDRVTVEV